MANLDVQPKKKGSMLPLILIALVVLALLAFLARGCGNDADDDATPHANDTVVATTPATGVNNSWDDVNFDAPAVQYEEITNRDIEVRGNEHYSIYGLGEDVLFEKGSADIKNGAEANLQQIAASLNKRYNGGEVRIYGYTDSTGSADANRNLAQKRAESVRNWLTTKANISSDKTTVHSMGETQPASSNDTEGGRQQNRRVKIVARTAVAH